MSAIESPHAKDPQRRSIGQRLATELRRFVGMFAYLWVIFGIYVLAERIILREHGIPFTAQGLAFFNALVLAKVMLVAEDLKVGRWFLQDRPLIVRILFEDSVFVVVFIVFHILESLVVGLIGGKTAAESVPAIGGGGLVGLVCVAILYFLALIPYFGYRNLNRALEPGKLHVVLFGPPPQSLA